MAQHINCSLTGLMAKEELFCYLSHYKCESQYVLQGRLTIYNYGLSRIIENVHPI